MNSLNKLASGAYLWYTLISPAPACIRSTVSRLKGCVHVQPRRSIIYPSWTTLSQHGQKSQHHTEESKLHGQHSQHHTEESKLGLLKTEIKAVGSKIQDLRASGASNMELKKQYIELKALNKELEALLLRLRPPSTFDRDQMLQLAQRCFYFGPAFEPYRGVAGLYDLGPLGTGLLNNLVREWERLFVRRDAMLQVTSSVLTPEPVLKASGHVDKFADYMVKDAKTGECYRLDHLIKMHLEKKMGDKKTSAEEKATLTGVLARLDGMDVTELGALVKQHDMKAPATGNALTEPVEFNLMFPINIGPSGHIRGFLRPETAQGIFVNFKRLLEYNQSRLPFAAAQVGNAYRNEISPRSGLLRVREFTMAEIEHFCFPDDKSHAKFDSVAGEVMTLYSACAQMSGESAKKITIGEAVRGGLVNNETLGYYMARIQQYLLRIGIRPSKLRFRQHMGNEMAHYACDCWDAECLTSYGWIECVGCADRSAYDLSCHAKATGVRLTVERNLPEPKLVEAVVPILDKGLIGKSFKKDAKDVQEALAALTITEVEDLDKTLSVDGGKFKLPNTQFEVTRAMVPSVKKESKRVHVEEIVPSVIEPSFGIGRVFYALLEQTFTVREEDDKRTYFALPTVVAPVKVSVLPLSSKPEFAPFTQQLASELTEANLSVKIDDSTGSIGRRYARTDEISIPYAVTIDFDTLSETPATVTLRERDTTQQIRIPVSEVAPTVQRLAAGKCQWADVASKWPRFTQQEATK